MPYFNPEKYEEEINTLSPELKALVVHRFLEAVQHYSDDIIQKKKKLLQTNKYDAIQRKKLAKWLHYKEFNQIALDEIEDGTLDPWFDTL